MTHNHRIDITDFCDSYNPIVKSYAVEFLSKIMSLEDIRTLLFNDVNTKTTKEIIDFADQSSDNYLSSFIYRLVGVKEIIFCRENRAQLDTNEVWKLISKSIRVIPSGLTISSIGSQGFLSIPLYKQDASLGNFDFIRLHIWDDSLDEYMDMKKCLDFSIHSHTFFAKSWIIIGKVKNDRYEYKIDSNGTHSFFEVQYNKSLNEVNQHTSKAVNKNINAILFKTSEETHFSKGNYEIEPSKLHQSGHLNSPNPSATFFSFTGKDGLGESFVIGPKDIAESEINRKMNISPIYLLDKIDTQI
ncbi:hypothetical protein [Spirosoma linguale]|uniref:Uncharacterized protein n=1 Tax=Spirosoma linguale (strain ATCC 33905 / DSM 74 / LMG 10896 / Claus 1) TaxID=504472 RepID=D2QBE6_SPILD|nr:hypothetical protein Slin_0055 [Spirosoma linguale DSM 74]